MKKKMKKTEILFVGRGGQGLVTAAPVLGQAYLLMEKFILAFAKFGVERRGAPILAFLRISDKKLNDRWEITEPDIIVFSSEDLIRVFPGFFPRMKENGTIIINTPKQPDNFSDLTKWKKNCRIMTLDATQIAIDNGIGSIMNPITNTTLVGAVAKAMETPWEFIEQAIQKEISKSDINIKAALSAAQKAFILNIRNKKVADIPVSVAPAIKDFEKYIVSVTERDATENKTGFWRMAGKPVIDLMKCNNCGLCAEFCPDVSAYKGEKQPLIDYDHCKGCGICAQECPKKAIQIVMEDKS